VADADAALVHGALAGLARALAQVASDPDATDHRASVLEPALRPLREMTDKFGTVTVTVEPGALRFEGERVYADEQGAAGFCSRLYRDGVRSLTFRRGVLLPELQAFAAAIVPARLETDENAVAELWKADLGTIQYTAVRENLLAGHSAAAAFASEVQQLTSKARDAVEYVDADASLLDRTQPPPLWSEEQLKKYDAQSWGDLAARATLTIEHIVEEDLAGWDLEALQQTFGRIIAEMAMRAEVQALVTALEGVAAMRGAHAPAFRAFVGRHLAEPQRFSRALVLATAPVKTARQLLEIWTKLLPDDAGPALLAALYDARDDLASVLAAAAARRHASCGAELVQLFREAAVPTVLAALDALPEDGREGAAAAIVERLSASAKVPDGDLAALYAALGRMRSAAGRAFLAERLAQPAKGLFRKRRSEREQLLAIEALASDGSVFALRIVSDAAEGKHGHGEAVSAAARAAVERLRARRQVREGKSR
jgi:hypothetical protein